MDKKQIIARCKKEKIQFIQLQFSDFDGIVKCVEIPLSQLPEALERGKWFDGSSVEGFSRIAESDMVLMPDTDTFSELPFRDEDDYKVARIICDVLTTDYKPFEGDPRYILKKNLEVAKKMGYSYFVGPELEFFLFGKDDDNKILTKTIDSAGYFDCFDDWAQGVREEIAIAATKMGIEIETIHHEVSNSQHEIDFKYSNALQAADSVMTLKFVIKAVAERYGLHATFMPKPVFGINGSGMHVHQSLWRNSSNAFYDDKDPYKISKIAKQFIAGQLACAPGICLALSPLVNSYKRLVPGYEAPVYLSWARINRSALIRVPQIPAGNKKSARIELRSPDPSCNPYLAFSVMLAAGLKGIRQKMESPKPVEENIYEMNETERSSREITTLPDSLGKAIEEFSRSAIAKEALGEHCFNRFVESNLVEWDSYRIQVTPWEVDQYLGKF